MSLIAPLLADRTQWGLTVNTEGAGRFHAAHAVLRHTRVGPLVFRPHTPNPKAVVAPDLIPAPLPTPGLGWPRLQTTFVSPRTDRQTPGTTGRPQQGQKPSEWSWGWTGQGPRLGEQTRLGVRGDLPPHAPGRGTHWSWLARLTCLRAVLRPPFASVAGAGGPLAPHRGNVQGPQPGPPGSLVSAGTRVALWRGRGGTIGGLHSRGLPRLPAPPLQTPARLPWTTSSAGALSRSPAMLEATHTYIPASLLCVCDIISFPPRSCGGITGTLVLYRHQSMFA